MKCTSIQSMIDAYRSFHDSHQGVMGDIATSQSPDTMIITCSDSRIELGHLFGAGPGDLFVVRNVANIVPVPENDQSSHGVSAALEFAVKFLKVKNIIVMGHSNCGGIRALSQEHAQTEYIDRWVAHILEAKERLKKDYDSEDALLEALEKKNIILGLERLMEFPWIREAVQGHQLTLHGWHFDFKTATISGYLDGSFKKI